MHTEIFHPTDPPKERRTIPARSPKQAAETEQQLRQLHRDFIRRKREILERVFNR